MIPIENIITSKINARICRRANITNSETIQDILKECCSDLKISMPTLFCCDSLTKSLSAFTLREKPYIIYDNGLIEALHIFNSITTTDYNSCDIDKLFYKLFAEELALRGDLLYSLYFAGRYDQLSFSFDAIESDNVDFIRHQLTYQIYFLIGHELTHLALRLADEWIVPDKFSRLIQVATRMLTERFIKSGMTEIDVLSRISGYFLKEETHNLDEYMNLIIKSDRFIHFVEECYCDFKGFKLLMEHYANPDEAIGAITNALNFLIILESIKSDLSEGIHKLNSTRKEAEDTLYYSVLRVQVLLIILQMNEAQEIKITLSGVKDCSLITKRLKAFIESLPDEDTLKKVNSSMLHNLNNERLIDSFVNAVYVYDDKLVLTFNYNEANTTVTLDEVNGSIIECSGAPLKNSSRHTTCGCFFAFKTFTIC